MVLCSVSFRLSVSCIDKMPPLTKCLHWQNASIDKMPPLKKCLHWQNASIDKMPPLTKCLHWQNASIDKMPPLTKCLHWQNASIGKMLLLKRWHYWQIKTIGKMSLGTKMTNFGEIVSMVTRLTFFGKISLIAKSQYVWQNRACKRSLMFLLQRLSWRKNERQMWHQGHKNFFLCRSS